MELRSTLALAFASMMRAREAVSGGITVTCRQSAAITYFCVGANLPTRFDHHLDHLFDVFDRAITSRDSDFHQAANSEFARVGRHLSKIVTAALASVQRPSSPTFPHGVYGTDKAILVPAH